MANNWMKGVPAASVSPVIFGFNSEVTMANDEARERAKKAYFKKVGHYTITRSFDAGFDAGYDAAESRIAELEKEVERLKNILRQVPNNCDKCGHSQRHHGGYGGGSGCTFWCCSCLDYLNYIERLCEGIEF